MKTPTEANSQKSVVLYARVSTERQAVKDLSIPDQLNRMRAYCEANDYRILDEYIEEGRTATNDNRPALQAMVHRVTNQGERVHAIVVHSYSRAFRNVTDLAVYLRRLKAVGTQLISISQKVDNSPVGQIITFVYGLFDELSSAENSKHVKRAMEENARRGCFNGSKPPYGYKAAETKVIGRTGYRKVLVINEEEATIVRQIYDLYEGITASGQMGMKKIVEHLNARCLRRGQLWRTQELQRILSDPVYTGVYIFGARTNKKNTSDEEGGDNDNSHVSVPVPVIIEKERFERIVVRRASRAPRNKPAAFEDDGEEEIGKREFVEIVPVRQVKIRAQHAFQTPIGQLNLAVVD